MVTTAQWFNTKNDKSESYQKYYHLHCYGGFFVLTETASRSPLLSGRNGIALQCSGTWERHQWHKKPLSRVEPPLQYVCTNPPLK